MTDRHNATPEQPVTQTVPVDPAVLDALNTDLLDALAAVERARQRLEQARAGRGSAADAPPYNTPPGVRYRLKPDALEKIRAHLDMQRSFAAGFRPATGGANRERA